MDNYYAFFQEGSDDPAYRHAYLPVLHVFGDDVERDAFVRANGPTSWGDYAVAVDDAEVASTYYEEVVIHL